MKITASSGSGAGPHSIGDEEEIFPLSYKCFEEISLEGRGTGTASKKGLMEWKGGRLTNYYGIAKTITYSIKQ